MRGGQHENARATRYVDKSYLFGMVEKQGEEATKDVYFEKQLHWGWYRDSLMRSMTDFLADQLARPMV